MAGAEERAVRKLEKQIAKTQERLTKVESKKRRRGGLLGGVVLGTVGGGLLAYYYLTQRNQDDEWEQEGADNAILLREQPTPTGQTADIKPLPKLNVAPAEKDTNKVAATTLEETNPAAEATQPTTNTNRPAALTGTAEAQPPQETAAPTPQPAARAEQSAKAEHPAKAEQPTKAKPEQTKDAPSAVATERPEIVLAKASGNTDEELAEATSNEPEPATTEMSAEPVDGMCPASHPIKGNRGSMGALIYHVPGGRNYDRTKPEACFATIEDAEAAGYRAPRG
jgi:outer membrane biosynthesis protein TonB